MLSRTDLERIAGTLTKGNVGHAETLYLQDVVLATISRETAGELVFKGGTALLKFYQLDRFSEDLDFTARETIDWGEVVGRSVRDLENYGATVAERADEESEASFSSRLGIEGPLYTGERRSLCFLRVEVNTRAFASRVRDLRYNPMFPDVPSFDLDVLDEDEIIAEKVRALMTRHQPRDLYDVYHLVERSVRIDQDLVQMKLDYYDLDFDPEAVIEAAGALERNWGTLDVLTYSEPPAFDEAMAALERALAG